MISEKLKLLSVLQQQHLLSRLKKQNEQQKAIAHVRDALALTSAMRANSS